MAPVLLEVPASSLTGFSIKIRCGPRGTRFPIISRPSQESSSSSPNAPNALLASDSNPAKDLQTSDSLERALHVTFDDDVEGAYLKLSFTPTTESKSDSASRPGSQESFLNHASTNLSWGDSTPPYAPSLPDPGLWSYGDHHIPNQNLCQDNRQLSSEPMSIDPTLNQSSEFDFRHLEHVHGLNPISPFPNNSDDLNSLMSILSRSPYTSPTPFHSTTPSTSSQTNSIISAQPNPIQPIPTTRRASQSSTASSIPTHPPTPSPSDSGDSDFTSNTSNSFAPMSTTTTTTSSGATETLITHPYSCPNPGCNRRFKREYNLSLHIRTHEPRPKKRFACAFPECNGLRFSRKHDLFRHICNLHSDTASWTCDWCSSEFPNSEALVAHIRLHYEREAGSQGIAAA